MEAVMMAFNVKKLESAQSKLATWITYKTRICLFCTSVYRDVTTYEQRKMV